MGQDDEDMSELVPVLLADEKASSQEDHRGETQEKGGHLVVEGYKKELESLVEDTKASVPVSLERPRLLRSSLTHRI